MRAKAYLLAATAAFAATSCASGLKRIAPPGIVKYEDRAKGQPVSPAIEARIETYQKEEAGGFPILGEQPSLAPAGIAAPERAAMEQALLAERDRVNEAVAADRLLAARANGPVEADRVEIVATRAGTLRCSSGMRLVGPNCMGIVNTAGAVRMLGMFAPFEPPAGNVAMITQSGALGLALMAQAGQLSLGVSTFISVGNKADVSSNDLLQYWEADEATEVILLYLESFGNPRYFSRIARRVSRAKPIVAVKSGRTATGLEAAASHTAALAHSDRAADALFEQTGVIRVDTLAEFFSVARLLAAQPIPSGRRLGILTNGGGPGVIAVDAAIAGGLDVPKLSPATQERLRDRLPNAASVANPVDIIASGGPKEYQAALEILCDDPDLDALVVIFIPPLATSPREVAQVVSDVLAARPHLRKPVTAVFFDPYSPLVSIPITEQREGARARRSVPVYSFPESAVVALGAAARYGAWRAAPTGTIVEVPFDRDAARALLDAHAGADWLPPEAVAQLLQTVGIDLAPANPADIVAEVIAGVTHDPIFGPLVAFGSGGHLVELLDDASFRVLPLTDRDAAEMIRATRAHRLLRGYRGASAGDLPAIELLLLRLGALADAFPEIAEIDLNPILVHPPGHGVAVRKARVRLVGEPGREESLCHPLL